MRGFYEFDGSCSGDWLFVADRYDEHIATMDGRNSFEGWRVSDCFGGVRDVKVFIV